MDEFLRPYLVICGTAAVLFGIWWAVRGIVRSVISRVAGRTIETTRRISPPATVAEGANAWSCGRCRSVNRPEATTCYSCRGDRSEVSTSRGGSEPSRTPARRGGSAVGRVRARSRASAPRPRVRPYVGALRPRIDIRRAAAGHGARGQ